jgi:undecaprenyl-diphosphatase
MSIEQLIILALIQGLTEFLPISSSAHLILLPELTEWPDQGPLIDVAVHVGSLFAVLAYFRKEAQALVRGAFDVLRQKLTPEARLALHLAIATVPVLVFGAILVALDVVDSLRSAEVIGWATILFGILLLEADRVGLKMKRMDDMTLRGALWIGLAQMLALIPGTSRAGITMTAGRFLGYTRTEAARFSMLLSIPTILAFGLVAAIDLAESGEAIAQQSAIIAMALSFVAAFASIWVFMALVERIGLLPFVLYRFVLGAGLLGYVYFIR